MLLTDEANGAIDAYEQAGTGQKPLYSIVGQVSAPTGIAVDQYGDFYVGDQSANTIVVFHSGQKMPYRTLTVATAVDGVAVDVHGTVYSIGTSSPYNRNSVNVYPPGATEPLYQFRANFSSAAVSVAVDGNGDVFVDDSAGELDEFPAGSPTPVVLRSNLESPSALAFDSSQNLIVIERGLGVEVFAPPYAGNAIARLKSKDVLTSVSLNSPGNAVWVTDTTKRFAEQLSYPAFKKISATSKKGLSAELAGIAASPAPPEAFPAQTLVVTDDEASGGAYYYNADAPGSATNFLAAPYATYVVVDDISNLYISQAGSVNALEEYYAAGGGFAYYTDVSGPGAVAVGSGSNPLIDLVNMGRELLIFPENVNNPSTYVDPNLEYLFSVIVDGATNGYVVGLAQNNRYEVDILETNYGTINLGLQVPGTPHGLAQDQAGNLLLAGSEGIAVFPAGSTTPATTFDTGGVPVALVFGNGGGWLYVLNAAPAVQLYAYPELILIATWDASELPANPTYNGLAVEPRVPLFNPAQNYFGKNLHRRSWADVTGKRMPMSSFTHHSLETRS